VYSHFEKEIDTDEEITGDPLQGYDWNQKATITEIRERGIHLLNQMNLALVRAICEDIEKI
jgi:hypothetical protein